ncbi:MAG: NADP-dependent oxidoreductase [Bacteroidetes bacterium]|nr:MAG: NADP-dependent oxidoreductase [Bacteroidota bacterium]
MDSLQFVLASRPSGFPASENFRKEKTELAGLKDNEVLLKSWFISVDPYMRGRMNDVKSYAASFEVDQPIRGGVVAKVIESRSKSINKGDTVVGILPWATWCTENAENLRKVDIHSFPPGYYLGILGMPGFTAYFGMMDIGKPKKGESVVISGAAGAVGIVAGQIAKIQGSKVIGITGSDEKCRLLKEKFGFDEAINYKTSKSLRKVIASACPEGVDMYFDNVGGDITDAVVPNLDFHARIALCGQISHYNNTTLPMGISILPFLLTRSVMLQGFIVSNYSIRFGEALKQLSEWVKDGKLKYTETIMQGFDKLPEAFLGLFEGRNKGKMLVEAE